MGHHQKQQQQHNHRKRPSQATTLAMELPPPRGGAPTAPPPAPAAPARKAPVPRCRCIKPSPATQLRRAFAQLTEGLGEWAGLRPNLGLQSGTSVVAELQLARLRQLACRVQLLVFSDAQAAALLVELAAGLPAQAFQDLHCLLTSVGLEELSDFIAVLCRHSCSTCTPAAARTKRAAEAEVQQLGQQRQAGASSARLTSSVLKSHDGASSSSSGDGGMVLRTHRQRAAGGLFDLTALDFAQQAASDVLQLRSPAAAGPDDDAMHHHHQDKQRHPSSSLRFAALLPRGHPLVTTAQELQQQHEFQGTLAMAAAAAAAAPASTCMRQPAAGSQGVVPIPGLQQFGKDASPLVLTARLTTDCMHQQLTQRAAGACCQHAAARAVPGMPRQTMPTSTDLERRWRAGRAATTAAVLAGAHLPVRESPCQAAALALMPGLVVQRRQPRHPAAAATDSHPASGSSSPRQGGPAFSRRSSISVAGSRPGTAGGSARSSRPGSAAAAGVPLLALGKVVAGGGGSSSSRPGSAAGSPSRLGGGRATSTQLNCGDGGPLS